MIKSINYSVAFFIRILGGIILKNRSKLAHDLCKIKSVISSLDKCNIHFPKELVISVIVIEDRRFFSHIGVDLYSICRALIKNVFYKKLEGASTISQQLVRSIINEREINIKRKIREIFLAVLVEKCFTKKQILTAYFETYKFSHCIGLINLCKLEGYRIISLPLNESAQIAARFKYPYITQRNYIRYLKRIRTIEIKTNSELLKLSNNPVVTKIEAVKVARLSQIEGADRVGRIDEIVYELYGVTEEERGIENV